MMPLFRMALLGGVVFLGAVGVFLGVVVMLTSWQNGAITWSYTDAGRDVTQTVTRAADAARYWRLYGTMGVLPAVLGAAAVLFGLRALRR